MRTVQDIAEEFNRTGRLRVCGEMEITPPMTLYSALVEMRRVGESCGYVVQRVGAHVIRIEGGSVPDRHCYELDWEDPASPGPGTIRLLHNIDEQRI